jgi:hypothetical protein
MNRGARSQGARRERSLPWRSRRLRGMLLAASFVGALLLVAPLDADAAPPLNTSPPIVSGTLEPGHTVSASTGTWTDATSPIASYEYQWQHCVSSIEEGYDCTNIDYAVGSSYTLPWNLAGVQARVVVVATDESGEIGIASSEVTEVITSGARYIVGESAVGNGSVTGYVTAPATSRTADANLSCPSSCGTRYSYLPGTEVELIATSAPGSAFLGWGGACSGSAPTCSFTLSSDEAATATFSGQAISTPVLPLGPEGRAGGAEPPSAGPPALGAWETPAPSAASLLARLTSLHYRRRHVQAEVRCQEMRTCRLSLAIFAGISTTSHPMIAWRSFAVPAQRSARISLALDRQAARILARRHRLPVTARLMLSGAGRASVVEQGRFTLTA